jgi:hypothetical protein
MPKMVSSQSRQTLSSPSAIVVQPSKVGHVGAGGADEELEIISEPISSSTDRNHEIQALRPCDRTGDAHVWTRAQRCGSRWRLLNLVSEGRIPLHGLYMQAVRHVRDCQRGSIGQNIASHQDTRGYVDIEPALDRIRYALLGLDGGTFPASRRVSPLFQVFQALPQLLKLESHSLFPKSPRFIPPQSHAFADHDSICTTSTGVDGSMAAAQIHRPHRLRFRLSPTLATACQEWSPSLAQSSPRRSSPKYHP